MQSSRKVRLLFVLHSSNLGGAERLHIELIENLIERQFETISVLPNQDGGLSEWIKNSGGQVRQVDMMECWTDTNFSLSIDELAGHPCTQSIIEIITSEKIDLVVTHTGVIPYGALAARVSGVPHIWYLHEFIDKDHGMKIPFGRELFSSFIDKHSDQIWSNSKAIVNYFFSTKSRKTRVVYNIPKVDITKLSSLEMCNKRQIGVIGNFDGGKNIETVIRSCGLLSLKTTDFKLNIFGWGSEVKVHELISLVKSLGISDNVFFHGVKSDLYEMYDQIDVLVMASKNESFGRTPFEAIQLGIPVLCSVSEATSEYMVDRKNGLMFSPDSPEELSSKLLEIFDSRDFREELVRNAFTSFEEWKFNKHDPELPSALIQGVIRRFKVKNTFNKLRKKFSSKL